MATVAEVTARITADISDFTAGMRRAADAADTLRREAAGLRDTPIDANARPFIDAVDTANHRLDALQADARHPILVRGNVSGLTGPMANATGSMGVMGAMAANTDKKVGKAGLMGTLGKVGMVGGVAALGVGIVASQLGGLAQKAQDSIAVTRTTEQIIKNTGSAANVTSEQVAALAGSISAKSGIDDEAIQSGMNLLLTFQKVSNAGTGQAAVFDRASAAAVDLAATGFTSVEGASKMLGKALNDPTKGLTALGRAGVKFTDAETNKIKALQKSGDLLGAQQMILDKVEGKVKGVAEAAASPMEKLAVMFENFQETVGAGLLPVIEQMGKVLAPIFDQLAGPLSNVINMIGGVFLQVLEAIGPALGPMVTALGSIAAMAGGALASALTALVPALIPIMSTFTDLAKNIGPILTPLLGTIGELIGMILQAVSPLLAPLSDLIQTILGTAAQILMPVADALMAIVSALAPIFASLGPILPLFGQLISMLGPILTPILTALVPLITAVAGVLAEVLGRAIGLTTAGIGGLILAFSYVAPFVLRNVTTPVVSAFLTMASNIVGAAAQAFSWVPGLGDKLETAKSAIDTFKSSATAGIENAASTIETEGRAIGESMRQAGTDMLVNGPPEAKAAGVAMGTSLGDGVKSQMGAVSKAAVEHGTKAGMAIATGARNAQGDVTSAANTLGTGLGQGALNAIDAQIPTVEAKAREMGRRAAQAVLAGAQVSSPSRITAQAGEGIVQGVSVGIQSAAASALRLAYSFGKATVDQVTSATQQALDAYKRRAQSAYDLFTQTRQAMQDFGSVTSIQMPDGAAPSLTDILGNMKGRLDAIRKFGSNLDKLRKMKLRNDVLQQIIAAGPVQGGAIAEAILAAGQRGVSQVNEAQGALVRAGGRVGDVATQSQYGMTGAQARGVVTTTVNVQQGAVTINFGDNVRASDRSAIKSVVDRAVKAALAEAAREGSR